MTITRRLFLPLLPLVPVLLGWALAGRGFPADPFPAGAAADGEILLEEVADLVRTVGPRPAGSEPAARARAWVAMRLEAAGLEASVQQGTLGQAIAFWERLGVTLWPGERGETPLENRIVAFPQPGQPAATLPGRVLVMGHTDSVARAPGAEDNASGVAVCLDLCRFLAEHPPRRRVTVAFTDGEEDWLLGACLMAARMSPAEREEISLALAVEMSGWNERPYLHWFTSAATFRWNPPPPDPVLALILGSGTEAGSFGQAGPLSGWLFPAMRDHVSIPNDADHRPFEMLGRPAVMMTTSSLSAFYPWYHTPQDTPDKLNARALGRSASALRAAVHALASTPRIDAGAGSYGYAWFDRVIPALWLRLGFAGAALAGLLAGLAGAGIAAWAGTAAFLVLTVLSPPSLLGAGLALPAAVICLAAHGLSSRLFRGLLALVGMVPFLFAAAFYLVAVSTFGSGTQLNLKPVETVAVAVALLACLVLAAKGPRPRPSGSPPPSSSSR